MNWTITKAIPMLALSIVCACSPDAETPVSEQPVSEEAVPPAQIHHAIFYIELTVTDMAAAQAFYSAAFGWSFTDYGPEYAGIHKVGGEGEAGGLRLDTEVKTGGPLVVLYSDDLEATLAAVRAAGGRIVTEPFAFPGGRRFHFADPSGNELAVASAD